MRQKGELDLVRSKGEKMNQAGLVSSVLEGRYTLRPYRLTCLEDSVRKIRSSEGHGQARISVLPNGRQALGGPQHLLALLLFM